MGGMNDVTLLLHQIESGDRKAASQLLPLIYDDLRQLAAQKMASERKGHTLQATALVHDAYLRLVGVEEVPKWENRRHFFAAAAEAMRRILVDSARRKQSLKRGGSLVRETLDESNLTSPAHKEDLCELDAALRRLEEVDPQAAQLINLRYFAGLTSRQAADLMGVSPRTADRIWGYARAWLHKEMRSE